MSTFFKHTSKPSFELFSSHECWTPSWGGIMAALGLYAAGLLLSTLLIAAVLTALGNDNRYFIYIYSVAYIVTFVPVYIFSAVKSSLSRGFNTPVPLDVNDRVRKAGVLPCIIFGILATVGFILVSDPLGYILPPMSNELRSALEMITNGPIAISMIVCCIFAPFFEEWFCRGIILRGLLRAKRCTPFVAILISALFFGIIHGNLYQGVPAFIAGCFFGYIYYKTGSLKLTMLMHCINNLASVILTHIPFFDDKDYLYQAFDNPFAYWALVCAGLATLVLSLLHFARIEKEENAISE